MNDLKNPTHKTAKAVKKFNRRTLLASGAALAAFVPTAPMFVRNAFAATSGECPNVGRVFARLSDC